MQIGTLRALFEAGYKPDLLVGTSIGSVNAAGLAMWGVNMERIAALEGAYRSMAEGHLMNTPGRTASLINITALRSLLAKQASIQRL